MANVKIRMLRDWKGYRVGQVIEPGAAAREMLLGACDIFRRPVAEIMDDIPANDAPKKSKAKIK